jgi:hypothetical protein
MGKEQLRAWILEVTRLLFVLYEKFYEVKEIRF